jgi:hypothetical protein
MRVLRVRQVAGQSRRWLWAGWLGWALAASGGQTLFSCDFESAAVGKMPDDFLVLEGAFSVQSEAGNKYLELPGAPVDSFGVLFGTAVTNNAAVLARVYGTSKGRRTPVFGVGMNGAGGLKLLVAPGKGTLEIMRGDESLAHVDYRWESGKWTWVRLEVTRSGPETWEAKGKAWVEGSAEPAGWQVTYREKSELAPGKAAVWGSPLSGTPIRYDDLKVSTVND